MADEWLKGSSNQPDIAYVVEMRKKLTDASKVYQAACKGMKDRPETSRIKSAEEMVAITERHVKEAQAVCMAARQELEQLRAAVKAAENAEALEEQAWEDLLDAWDEWQEVYLDY